MNHKPKPSSRLIIVFILAMVLSGGILTYFSINNISNQKELTEKKILEEQQKLAARFFISVQENLEQLADGLFKKSDQEFNGLDTMIQIEAAHDYILQSFLVRNNGDFIFPCFTGISEQLLKPLLSNDFSVMYNRGEKAEFSENDADDARDHYRSCLRLARGKIDSATALNALGRIYLKLGDADEATVYYITLIRDFYSESDRNGFPFAYYALSNLVNHTNEDNLEKILPVIESCLSKMEQGSIPLNYQSGELLDLISVWANKQMIGDSVLFQQIESSIAKLNKQLLFIDQYGDELKTIMMEGNSRIQPHDENGIRIETFSSDQVPQFLMFKEAPEYCAGFLIDQNSFFDTLAHAVLQDDLAFNYMINSTSPDSSSISSYNLTYLFQLNPFFPEQTIQIYPQNEDLIEDLVKRRSWIYGIATFLLLVAMLLGIILTLRDIAREKTLANLRSDFISNVTHELKTPLTSIRMYAESLMLRRITTGPGHQKYLSVIVNESERLKRMINNILEFSKIEKAKQDYHPVESNLSEILYSAIQDMNYWLEKNGFSLSEEIEPDMHAVVDPEKLYQVYTNLLSNAIKYSGDSKNIFVRLYKNHDAVITEVEDEGIGISKEDQLKIFDEFYRVENHESGNITGTGLGLTVVREIVAAHHGEIKVESEIGKGSKFSVILFQQSANENHSDH